MISFALTLPPSSNRLWIHPKGAKRRTLSPEYREWIVQAKKEIEACYLEPVHGRFKIMIAYNENMGGDLDNYTKATLDICQKTKLIENDRLSWGQYIERLPNVPEGKCLITIKPSKPADDAGFGAAGGALVTRAAPIPERGAAPACL